MIIIAKKKSWFLSKKNRKTTQTHETTTTNVSHTWYAQFIWCRSLLHESTRYTPFQCSLNWNDKDENKSASFEFEQYFHCLQFCVYDFSLALKENGFFSCALALKHWPLSISDAFVELYRSCFFPFVMIIGWLLLWCGVFIYLVYSFEISLREFQSRWNFQFLQYR